jgi:hypothetical protein
MVNPVTNFFSCRVKITFLCGKNLKQILQLTSDSSLTYAARLQKLYYYSFFVDRIRSALNFYNDQKKMDVSNY